MAEGLAPGGKTKETAYSCHMRKLSLSKHVHNIALNPVSIQQLSNCPQGCQ